MSLRIGFSYSPSVETTLEGSVDDLNFNKKKLMASLYTKNGVKGYGRFRPTNIETLIFTEILCKDVLYFEAKIKQELIRRDISQQTAQNLMQMRNTFDGIKGNIKQVNYYNFEDTSVFESVEDVLKKDSRITPYFSEVKYRKEILTMISSISSEITELYLVSGEVWHSSTKKPFIMGFCLINDEYVLQFSNIMIKDKDTEKLREKNICRISYVDKNKTINYKVMSFAGIRNILFNSTNPLFDIQKIVNPLNIEKIRRNYFENNISYYTYGVNDMEGLMEVS